MLVVGPASLYPRPLYPRPLYPWPLYPWPWFIPGLALVYPWFGPGHVSRSQVMSVGSRVMPVGSGVRDVTGSGVRDVTDSGVRDVTDSGHFDHFLTSFGTKGTLTPKVLTRGSTWLYPITYPIINLAHVVSRHQPAPAPSSMSPVQDAG